MPLNPNQQKQKQKKQKQLYCHAAHIISALNGTCEILEMTAFVC